MFTKAEHADQHCQMGNLDLAYRVLTEWLQDPNPGPDRPGLTGGDGLQQGAH